MGMDIEITGNGNKDRNYPIRMEGNGSSTV